MFTTYDRDNDHVSGSCALWNGGGFWYNYCSFASVNGRADGFRRTVNGIVNYLQSTRMWLMC